MAYGWGLIGVGVDWGWRKKWESGGGLYHTGMNFEQPRKMLITLPEKTRASQPFHITAALQKKSGLGPEGGTV